MNALAITVCQKKIYQRFPSLFLCKIGCARAKPKYDPGGIILTILVRSHPIMLQTKYERPPPMVCHKKIFKDCKIRVCPGRAQI